MMLLASLMLVHLFASINKISLAFLKKNKNIKASFVS
jgi:hypothetical protein